MIGRWSIVATFAAAISVCYFVFERVRGRSGTALSLDSSENRQLVLRDEFVRITERTVLKDRFSFN